MTSTDTALTATETLELLRRRPSLNLFPTENRMSDRAMSALSTDAVNRYPGSEGPGYHYGDVAQLDRIYGSCAALARRFFGSRHAFVNFLSGLHTMHTVVKSLLEPGAVVWIMDPTCGGHYATETICASHGFRPVLLPFERTQCVIDVERVEDLARTTPPAMVYLDLSTTVRLQPVTELRRIVGPDVLICVDASHLLGLMPIVDGRCGLAAGATSVSGSTHKTFPGPQKGLLVTNSDDVADRLGQRLPFMVSSGHSSSVAALAITMHELHDHRIAYAEQIVSNSRALAGDLARRGFRVSGGAFGFSETHQVWVELPDGTPAAAWGHRLAAAYVRSTTVVLPSTGRSGLRLGTQELTRVGMREPEMERIADLMCRLLLFGVSPESVGGDVAELTRSFQAVKFVTE